MTWQVSLVFYYLVTIGYALWRRRYSQISHLPETFPPALAYVIGVMPLGLIVGLLSPHHIHWGSALIELLATEGCFIGLCSWFAFKAIRRQPVGRYEAIVQLYELLVIVLGWSLLAEKLNAHQIVGGACLLIAALLAIHSSHKNPWTTGKKTKGAVTFALLAALTLGLGLIAEKAALKYIDIGAYFIFGYFAQTLAVVVLAGRDISRTTLSKIHIKDLRQTFVMGVLSASTGFFYLYALRTTNNISLINALAAFSMPLIVLASYVFLKEHKNLKILALATALGCLGLIISALH